jgi:tetratricopeptide (TPR) repeat protein
MPKRALRYGLCVAGALTLWAGAPPARAEEPWTWPTKMKNAQVLGKDFPAAKLSAVMRGFTRALGVRCTHCHVGEEGKDLSTYDFVSDANPNKQRAREMYLMLGSINEHLKKIQPSGDKRVNMWCNTCHHGRPRPMTLGEEMAEAYRKSGIDGAIARYRDLKERFDNAGAYDFRVGSLDSFGSDLVEEKDFKGGIAVLRLNTDQFPRSVDAWESLGDAYQAAGDPNQAKTSFHKALEIDPKNADVIEKLKKLEAKPS